MSGQTDTTTKQLQSVVITATQHAVQRSEAPAVVEVLGSEQLAAASAMNLAEGLTLGTGIRVENTCQNCGANEVRINGLSGEYTQILIDSRPLNSPLAGVYLLEMLPSAMIDRVEVMRGGGSALYGSAAIAGVVNVITKEPLYNSASAANTTRWVGDKAFDVSNQFGASVVSDNHQAGLFIFGQQRQRSPYDHDGDGYSEIGLLRSRLLGFRGFVRTGSHSKLGIEYHHLGEYRRGGDRFDLPSPQAHISEGGEHSINSGQLKWDFFSPSGRDLFSLFASAQHVDRQSYYGERDDSEPFGNAYGYTQSLTLDDGMRYSHTFERLWFAPATLTAGIEHTFDRLTDRVLVSTDTLQQRVTVWSAYLQNEWNHESWTLLAGARIDRHSLVAKPIVSPRLNLRYAPARHLVLRGGYSSGFRAPQVFDDDLHAGAVQGELYKITNAPNLGMERSHSFTASADFCFHLWQVDVDMLVEGFYTRIDDAFALVWVGDDGDYRLYQRCNADGAEVGGVNAEMQFEPLPSLQVQLGATLQRSTYLGAGIEYATDRFERKMERTPDLYGFLTATYQPSARWELTAKGVLTGPMLVYHSVADDVEQVITPTFFDLSLRASYTQPLGDGTQLQFQFGVQNLLNSFQRDFDRGPERDSKYIYGPTLPRTLFAGLKLTL